MQNIQLRCFLLTYNLRMIKFNWVILMENVCKFVKTKNYVDNLNIVNFVYEKEVAFKQSFLTSATHSLCLVTSGRGVLHTIFDNHPLNVGDLFFTFSSKPYYIENVENLQYIYISFIGLRSSGLLNRLEIKYDKPVYNDFSFLTKRWVEDFENSNDNNIDLKCESLLLHTLSFLCANKNERLIHKETNNMLLIKQYIDTNYTNPDISLKTIAEKFSYNPKYLSSAFAKLTKTPFTQYLCELRIKHSQSLMKSGIKSVQDISASSGFTDTHYFSKTFKKICGVSPRKYFEDYHKTK